MPIKHILVPIDFSPHSEVALDYAIELAGRLGAELRVLHCYYLAGAVPTPGHFLLSPTAWEEVRQGCTRRLKEAVERAQQRGVNAVWQLLQEPPGPAIVREAGLRDVDLIVMGSRGLTGLGRMFFGSVAERVVQQAPCSVLTLKDDQAEQDSGSPSEAN